jgi:putative PLP-dependent aminotransferase (TIGR04422 family)
MNVQILNIISCIFQLPTLNILNIFMFLKKKISQWPDSVNYSFKDNLRKVDKSKLDHIEKFFKKKYKAKYAFLAPSSRASINTVLKFLKFDRSKTVNIPKWCSHCLFETIGAVSNVNTHYFNSDLVIVFHKWGNTFKFKKRKKKQIIIEDSVDTLPDYKFKPFINNGICEIISLPKIIGSFSGGIVVTNNKKLYNFSKNLQFSNLNLGFAQSKKKLLRSKNKLKKFSSWYYYESFNSSLEGNMVNNIYKCLKNFELNVEIIKARRETLKNKFKNVTFNNERLGPCHLFKLKKFPKFKKILPIKHFDFSLKTENNNFEKCLMLPLHFGLKQNDFIKIISKLK